MQSEELNIEVECLLKSLEHKPVELPTLQGVMAHHQAAAAQHYSEFVKE